MRNYQRTIATRNGLLATATVGLVPIGNYSLELAVVLATIGAVGTGLRDQMFPDTPTTHYPHEMSQHEAQQAPRVGHARIRQRLLLALTLFGAMALGLHPFRILVFTGVVAGLAWIDAVSGTTFTLFSSPPQSRTEWIRAHRARLPNSNVYTCRTQAGTGVAWPASPWRQLAPLLTAAGLIGLVLGVSLGTWWFPIAWLGLPPLAGLLAYRWSIESTRESCLWSDGNQRTLLLGDAAFPLAEVAQLRSEPMGVQVDLPSGQRVFLPSKQPERLLETLVSI
jgi:hypothetical protein